MIHHVYANQSNVGDWLSARGIQSLLAPLAVTEHFCDEPFVKVTLAALDRTGPDDFIVIGGGGLFMDYFEPFWEGFQTVAARTPFVIWGVGCCDRKRARSRPFVPLISKIVSRARLCIVRDELTALLLGDSKIRTSIGCPALNAVPTTGGEQKRVLHVDHYPNVGPEIYERMVAVAKIFAEQTGRSFRRTNNLIPAGHNGALQKTLDLYASADLVLTSRLHGCIISLAMGRRVLAVSGDHKVESFMRAAGLSDWVCDLNDMESLATHLERLHEQPLPTEFVEGQRNENRAVAKQVRTLIEQRAAAASLA